MTYQDTPSCWLTTRRVPSCHFGHYRGSPSWNTLMFCLSINPLADNLFSEACKGLWIHLLRFLQDHPWAPRLSSMSGSCLDLRPKERRMPVNQLCVLLWYFALLALRFILSLSVLLILMARSWLFSRVGILWWYCVKLVKVFLNCRCIWSYFRKVEERLMHFWLGFHPEAIILLCTTALCFCCRCQSWVLCRDFCIALLHSSVKARISLVVLNSSNPRWFLSPWSWGISCCQ